MNKHLIWSGILIVLFDLAFIMGYIAKLLWLQFDVPRPLTLAVFWLILWKSGLVQLAVRTFFAAKRKGRKRSE
jgi:hypothetical protein